MTHVKLAVLSDEVAADTQTLVYNQDTNRWDPAVPDNGTSVTGSVATLSALPSPSEPGKAFVVEDEVALYVADDAGGYRGPFPVEGQATDAAVADKIANGSATAAALPPAVNPIIDARTGNGQRPVGQGEQGYTITPATAPTAAALTAALSSALSSGGTAVLRGSFTVASTVTVPDGLTVDGNGATITASTQITVLSVGSNVTIEGLTVRGPGNTAYASTGRGIVHKGTSTAYATGLRLRKCTIDGFGYSGVLMEYARDAQIHGCTIEHVGYAGIMGLSVTDALIEGNTVRDVTPGTTQAYGIILSHADAGTPRSQDCTVRANTVEDVPLWDALNTHSGSGIRFEGNTIRRCKKGVSMVGSFSTNAPQNCHVVGNRIYGTTAHAIDTVGAGTSGSFIQAAESCTITGNYLEDCGADESNSGGMVFYLTRNLIVSGNTIVRPRPAGINLDHTNVGITITGNTILDVHSATLAVAPAVYIRNQHNSGTIGGNAFLRVDLAVDTYVTRRGVRVDTMTNNALTVQPNYSTATLDYSGLSGAGAVFGDLGPSAKSYTATGSPEGAIVAGLGSMCVGTGGTAAPLWVKETGAGGAAGWVAVATVRTATSSQLNLATHAVNTTAKVAGREVFNTSANRPVYATGPNPSDVWVYADGTTAHTPA